MTRDARTGRIVGVSDAARRRGKPRRDGALRAHRASRARRVRASARNVLAHDACWVVRGDARRARRGEGSEGARGCEF